MENPAQPTVITSATRHRNGWIMAYSTTGSFLKPSWRSSLTESLESQYEGLISQATQVDIVIDGSYLQWLSPW